MAVCDGPLACHMLQRSLERYVSTCVGGPPEKQTTELKGWLMPVIAVIVDCLEQGILLGQCLFRCSQSVLAVIFAPYSS